MPTAHPLHEHHRTTSRISDNAPSLHKRTAKNAIEAMAKLAEFYLTENRKLDKPVAST